MKRLSLFMAAILFAVCSFAQLSIWDGTDDVWTKGAGTESSPYLIESAQQLAFIASMVNGGVTNYANTYFKLMTNVDLNGRAWSPISGFRGNFDGNNCHIFGSSSGSLFGSCTNATIKKIHVESQGLTGSVNNCVLENCTYKGSRVMAFSATNSRFIQCSSCIEINHEYASIGAGMVTQATECEFIGCSVSGSITSGYKELTNLNNDQNSFVGGIVGKSTRCKYIQCSGSADVFAWGGERPYKAIVNYGFSGGIVGLSVRDTFRYCNTLGNITASTETYYGGAGGIIGITSNYDTLRCSIYNSFTLNSRLNYVATNGNFVGISNILQRYSTSSTGSPRVSNSYTSSSKTEEAMKSASFPIVLNSDSTVFVKDITPNINDGYPIYANQVYVATDALTTIGFTSVQLLGHFYALNADSVGFEYKEAADNTHWYKSITGQANGNIITCDLGNLTTGTNYVYRSWVERNGVRYFGDVLSFTTQQCSKIITPITTSICQGEEYIYRGQTLTQSCICYDTLVASNGCDSIVKFTLTVMPTANIEKYDTILVGENYDFYGDILTETGDYEHYIPMANKCNLVILHLYVRQPSVVVTAASSDGTMGSVIGGGTYEKYSQVTLTAIPNIGCKFVKWTDNNTDNPRIITPTEDCSYTAVFEQIQYTLIVSSADTQKGNVSGGGTYTYGQKASIVATPNEGYSFKKWSDGDINASRTITIVSDSNLIASFEEIKCTLTLATNNATMGTISGAGVYTYGTEVTILATPNTGHQFFNWSDNDVNASRTFIITKDMSLTANFEALKYMVIATSNDDALGVVYGGGEYAYNAQASLMAVPNENCEFVTWNNGVNTNPCVFTVTNDVTIQAIFRHTGEGIEDVETNSTPQKMIQDGHIFILRGDKTYTITGQIVK